jgi:hypothetical protein
MDGFFPIGTFSFLGIKAANIETPGAMTSGLTIDLAKSCEYIVLEMVM